MSKTPSLVHSSIAANKVPTMGMNFSKDDCKDYRNLRKMGICLDERTVRQMAAMDSTQSPVTTASIAVPVQFLQNWLPGFVNTVTAAREIDEFIGIDTVGNWFDDEIVQPVLENLGIAVPFGDYTPVPFSSWNPNFVTRSVVNFESGLKVGPKEEARAATIRVNSGEAKRNSSGLALEIQRNLIGFNGYNSGADQTYGFLNDPNLPNYQNVAAGASTSLLWSRKTFLEICADIRTAIVALRTQSQGIIKPNAIACTLGLPTNAIDRLSTTSDFGESVWDWLKDNYPLVRVVDAIQLNAANGGVGVFYLYADRVNDGLSTDGGKTWAQVVPAKFQVVGIAKEAKGYVEDYLNATAGAMLKRPYAVVRYSGIS